MDLPTWRDAMAAAALAPPAVRRAREPLEPFPAPREDDCAYGCCKAGDVGIASEALTADDLFDRALGEGRR